MRGGGGDSHLEQKHCPSHQIRPPQPLPIITSRAPTSAQNNILLSMIESAHHPLSAKNIEVPPPSTQPHPSESPATIPESTRTPLTSIHQNSEQKSTDTHTPASTPIPIRTQKSAKQSTSNITNQNSSIFSSIEGETTRRHKAAEFFLPTEPRQSHSTVHQTTTPDSSSAKRTDVSSTYLSDEASAKLTDSPSAKLTDIKSAKLTDRKSAKQCK